MLSWATNAAGFHVEYRPRLDDTNWLRHWKPVVVASDQNTVTDAATEDERLYRLAVP